MKKIAARIKAKTTYLFLLVFLGLSLNIYAQADPEGDTTLIKISSENPFYWEVNGEPTLLIGGSIEDNLFQIDNLVEELDLMVEAGGNYLRSTMSSRDVGNEKPYRLIDGKYDLTKPNPAYWYKFQKFLNETDSRNIIIQVELWATYDFYNSSSGWAENVFNPKNNSNYTAEESELPEVVDYTAQFRINPFFETVPALNDIELVRKFQKDFIDRILSLSLDYDHILYTIDNETNAHPDWGKYWSEYIRKKAEHDGKKIYITEMWDNWDPTDGNVEGVRNQEDATHPFLERSKVANTINAPEFYDFVDISNNNAQNGEVHYRSSLYVRNWVERTSNVRPVNNVKIYGGTIFEEYTKDWAGSYKDGEERFWRNVFAGHASVRFHRPPHGHGLSALAQHHIKSMRMLTDSLDFFHHQPSNDMLEEREPNEAFSLAIPGEEYALYFPGKGSIHLNAKPGTYEMRWLHIRSSTWRNPKKIENPAIIKTPDNDQWALWLKKI
ncbi:MAG: hypothetical protein GVY20_09460 [Bacteroidetes bacterium]|jgi:hypothetical protein|nr:hypothetical protein [Bacteroidota bacterium]